MNYSLTAAPTYALLSYRDYLWWHNANLGDWWGGIYRIEPSIVL
jgi:hypothetical protein